jgi:hypothetical protein
MTVNLFAVGILLLSMSKSVFQAFAQAAAPQGMWRIFPSRDSGQNIDLRTAGINARNDVFALRGRGFGAGEIRKASVFR